MSQRLPPSTLIICSRNRPRLLRETIQSIVLGDEVPSELIVVDQSESPDASLEGMAAGRPCVIRHIASQTVGLCRARNIGIRHAATSILAFTDDDMWVERDWYGALIRGLVGAGPRSVVTGRVMAGNDRPGGFVPSLVTGESPRVWFGRVGTDVLAAGHMAMDRSTIEEIGLFDERLGAGARFPAADDNDYGFRLLEAGYRIVYVPQAVLYHRAWRSEREYFALRWAYGRGKGGYYAKYASLSDRYMLGRMIRDMGLRVLRFPWRVLHRPRLALGDLAYVGGIASGATEWLFTQPRQVPRARLA